MLGRKAAALLSIAAMVVVAADEESIQATVNTQQVQPDTKDVVHTHWINGPSVSEKLSGNWPEFGDEVVGTYYYPLYLKGSEGRSIWKDGTHLYVRFGYYMSSPVAFSVVPESSDAAAPITAESNGYFMCVKGDPSSRNMSDGISRNETFQIELASSCSSPNFYMDTHNNSLSGPIVHHDTGLCLGLNRTDVAWNARSANDAVMLSDDCSQAFQAWTSWKTPPGLEGGFKPASAVSSENYDPPRWNFPLEDGEAFRLVASNFDGRVDNISLVREDGVRWPYEIDYINHYAWPSGSQNRFFFYPFRSDQKVNGSYPDLTNEFDAFFYEQDMRFFLDYPAGGYPTDECTATRPTYTGYTANGRWNYCQRSSEKLDKEPYLAVNSGRIGAVVDVLFAEETDGRANLMPRLGPIVGYDAATFDPMVDVPQAFLGATLNLSRATAPNSPVGSYKLGLKSGSTFVETSLVRQGSTMTQITLSGFTWWSTDDGFEFQNLTNWFEMHVWGDSVTLVLWWDNSGVPCTEGCTPTGFGDGVDGTVTVDLTIAGKNHSFVTPLSAKNATALITVADTEKEYSAGEAATNDYSDCADWYGTQAEAESFCDLDPNCTVLHDWGCDGENWRYCSSVSWSSSGQACTLNPPTESAAYDKYEDMACSGRNEIYTGYPGSIDACAAVCGSDGSCTSFEWHTTAHSSAGLCQVSSSCTIDMATSYNNIDLYTRDTDTAAYTVRTSGGATDDVYSDLVVNVGTFSRGVSGDPTVLVRPGEIMVEVPEALEVCDYTSGCDGGYWLPFSLTNTAAERVSVRISLARSFYHPGVGKSDSVGSEITGFNVVMMDGEGFPSGLPVQISKNWHADDPPSSVTTWGGYSGKWWTASSLIALPSNSTYNGQWFVIMQKYGGYVQWSHAQLSLVGYSDAWLWHEAALGSGGESICFDPLGIHTRAAITDVRVSLFDQAWKGNVGGGDFMSYFNESGHFVYFKDLDPMIHSSGPCLSNATHTAISADDKIKVTFETLGKRTDDMVTVHFKIRYDVEKHTEFSRLSLFQLDADGYSYKLMSPERFTYVEIVCAIVAPVAFGCPAPSYFVTREHAHTLFVVCLSYRIVAPLSTTLRAIFTDILAEHQRRLSTTNGPKTNCQNGDNNSGPRADGQADSTTSSSSGGITAKPPPKELLVVPTLANGILWTLWVVFVVDRAGYDVSTVVSSLGVTGLLTGLALKNYAEDALSSFTLMTDRRFRIGDWIMFNGQFQVVQRIGLLTTRLRLSSGQIHYVSNSMLVKGPIVNDNECVTRRTVATVFVDPETRARALATLPNGLRHAAFSALDASGVFSDVKPNRTTPDAQLVGINEMGLQYDLVLMCPNTPADSTRYKRIRSVAYTAMIDYLQRRGVGLGCPRRRGATGPTALCDVATKPGTAASAVRVDGQESNPPTDSGTCTEPFVMYLNDGTTELRPNVAEACM